MIAARFHNDRSGRGVQYRNIDRQRCTQVRCRWEIRAWILAVDRHGSPVRLSSTFSTPSAMPLSQVTANVRQMLQELSLNDMQDPSMEGAYAQRAGWVAVSRHDSGSERRPRT